MMRSFSWWGMVAFIRWARRNKSAALNVMGSAMRTLPFPNGPDISVAGGALVGANALMVAISCPKLMLRSST